MAPLRTLKARDIERLENTSFATLILPAAPATVGDANIVSDRACSDWSCSGGQLCCPSGTVTESVVPTECSWTGTCATQDSCGSCSGAETCCPTGTATRSILNCDPTTECTTVFTEMFPTPIDELLRGGAQQAALQQAALPEPAPVDPQAPVGWKL